MNNIWFTGDTHIGHKNIVKGVSGWSDTSRCRDFNTVAEHDTKIIDTFNKYVAPDDILYHVGDWSFGGIQNIWNFRKRLNCKTVHLFLGNHDHHIEKNKVLPNVVEKIMVEKKAEIHQFLKDFPREDGRLEANQLNVTARRLFDSVGYVDLIKIEGHYIFLSHYSHRVWQGHNKGVIHLYGHSHGTLSELGKSMDVGVDVAFRMFREYRPFKFQEIQKIMANKDIHFIDHHNEKTNWR